MTGQKVSLLNPSGNFSLHGSRGHFGMGVAAEWGGGQGRRLSPHPGLSPRWAHLVGTLGGPCPSLPFLASWGTLWCSDMKQPIWGHLEREIYMDIENPKEAGGRAGGGRCPCLHCGIPAPTCQNSFLPGHGQPSVPSGLPSLWLQRYFSVRPRRERSAPRTAGRDTH